MSMSIVDLSEWLAIDYKNTNLSKLLDDINAVPQSKLVDVMNQYAGYFNIDTATGVWLDYVGYRLGVQMRPSLPITNQDIAFGFEGSDGVGFDQDPFVSDIQDSIPLSDEYFRPFLKTRAAQLITDATEETIRNELLLFFENVNVIDNQDMTMRVTIITDIPLDIAEAVIANGIITKPAGVFLIITITSGINLGFEGSTEVGFDQGAFVFE